MSFVRKMAALLIAGTAAALSASANAAEDFFSGKKITFVIGTSAGSPIDLWARMLTHSMARHIPGNPTFVLTYMPGAGTLNAANFVFNQAPRDGTTFFMGSRSIALVELIKNPAVKFKSREFGWIGSIDNINRVCTVYVGANVKPGSDPLEQELAFGGTGASSISTTPLLAQKLLGFKFKVVQGYPGPPEIMLAMERGEVDGICNALSGTESQRPGWIEQGKLKVLFNLEEQPIKGVPAISAPSIHSFAKTEEQKQILNFYNSGTLLGWPIQTTPEVPQERLALLRRAFDATMTDPEFVEDVKKANLGIHPTTGEDLAKTVEAIMSTPQGVIDKTLGIVGNMGD
jgi:tripartite-type tricarboxylate transporter receptor subunit TctC